MRCSHPAGPYGTFPFPAGLNDCSDALAWIDAHRAELGITGIVLQGESGGANLCLATQPAGLTSALTHGADSIYKSAVGDVYDSTIADIARFTRKVAPQP